MKKKLDKRSQVIDSGGSLMESDNRGKSCRRGKQRKEEEEEINEEMGEMKKDNEYRKRGGRRKWRVR